MDLLSIVLPKLKREYIKWRYYQAARRIHRTRPLGQGTLPFILLSMVQKRDVVPYLVAVKSFAQHANPHRVVVICDPSIDQNDRKTFHKHVPHIELRDASEFTDARIPRGGTWERLLAIANYASDNYVVQLDSDTVTIRPIPEVVDSIVNGTAFVLGGEPNERLMTLAQTFQLAKAIKVSWGKIQELAELKMIELDRPRDEKYVRGCSGFTGFPRSAAMEEKLFTYSAEMRNLIGDRWVEWGTEQVTSNYLVANSKGVVILPDKKYGTPNYATGDMAFFHFIGYTHYADTKYEITSRQVINALHTVSA